MLCVRVRVCRSEKSLREPLLFSPPHLRGPRDPSQFVGYGGKLLYLLRHLEGLIIFGFSYHSVVYFHQCI